MSAWARSASSAKTSMSISRIFKRISGGSSGMTGTCGIGDVYGRMRLRGISAAEGELFG